jgi:tannase
MPSAVWALAGLAILATVQATPPSIASICTVDYARSKLPIQDIYFEDGKYIALTIDPTSVHALAGYNYSVSDNVMYPDASFDYCQVTFAYSHTSSNDSVQVQYWLPSPSTFANRFLATGGGGLAINSGNTSLPGGVQYGAVSGITDGGFGGFTVQYDAVALLANGTLNYDTLYNFGYRSIHEMTFLGKLFTQEFYNMTNTTKLYSYYQACSEGGREGWSQVQRFTSFDGAIIGAPAFRYGHQQVNHLTSSVVESTQDYYPPPCELTAILNATLVFCDPLDGLTDGVVSRTDLCILEFNINSTLGLPYNCPVSTGGTSFGKKKRQMGPGGSSATPAQNGTVSAKAIAVAQTIINGLHDSQGRRAYLSYQPSATWTDAATSYNSTSESWGVEVDGLGGEWVAKWLMLLNISSITSYEGVTYDTLRDWMYEGWQQYEDVLQTTWPDLTLYHDAGGKVLHYHGESDYSIPTASSVHYWESVRSIMYSNMTYNASAAALNDWYRLYLVPGGSHCSTNTAEPNGPWPQTNLQVMINWVENGTVPTTLNATHLAGSNLGGNAQICAWPLRPIWINNGTTMDCVYDQKSHDTWIYEFDSFPMPVY